MVRPVGTARSPGTAAEFRRALGHYPTGVALITGRGAGGAPLGMVVGTLSSVSLDPPLIGFMPARSSTTWPAIAATGRFGVSVLGADQEHVCRAFATKAPERFAHLIGDSGNPRVPGAVLWADCEVGTVLPAGDHVVVLGAVRGLEVAEEPGLPLLFLRGGYGAPLLPSIQAEAAGLGVPLRLADLVRPEAEAVAAELGLECLVTAAVDGSIVVLAAAGIGLGRRSTTRVGTTFPLAAPFAPLFVAWASEPGRQAWLVRGRALGGVDPGPLAEAELRAVRDLGYAVTTGRASAELFERVVSGVDDEAGAQAVLAGLHDRGPEPGLRAPVAELADVTSMQMPVRDREGRVVLSLHLIGFRGDETPGRLETCFGRLRAGARTADDILSTQEDCS